MEKVDKKLLDKEDIINTTYEVKRVEGFIDSYTVENFLKRGWRVIQMYNGKTYLEKQYSLSHDERCLLYFIKLYLESRISYDEYLLRMSDLINTDLGNSKISESLNETCSSIETLSLLRSYDKDAVSTHKELLELKYKYYLYDIR